MSDQVLPTMAGLTWDVVQRPRFSTLNHRSVSGKEVRLSLMSYPLYEFVLSYSVLRSDSVNLEWQTLLGFYKARLGAFDTWLFTHPDDYTATDASFGTGNGTTTQFQLTRSLGGFSEPIQNVNALTNIKDNGVVVNPLNYTVGSTGIVTFTTPPTSGHALTWNGTFYYRCRFLQDMIEFNKFMTNFWALKKVEFISIKL